MGVGGRQRKAQDGIPDMKQMSQSLAQDLPPSIDSRWQQSARGLRLICQCVSVAPIISRICGRLTHRCVGGRAWAKGGTTMTTDRLIGSFVLLATCGDGPMTAATSRTGSRGLRPPGCTCVCQRRLQENSFDGGGLLLPDQASSRDRLCQWCSTGSSPGLSRAPCFSFCF